MFNLWIGKLLKRVRKYIPMVYILHMLFHIWKSKEQHNALGQRHLR